MTENERKQAILTLLENARRAKQEGTAFGLPAVDASDFDDSPSAIEQLRKVATTGVDSDRRNAIK